MLSRLLRGALSLFVAADLLSFSYFGINAQAQASTEEIDLGVDAPAFVTGPIYAQPIDPSGKLLLSSWLDPDGSDYDQYVWDNFTLQSNETITEIDWFGGYDPTRFGRGGRVLDFTVAIYPSNAAGTEPAVAGPPLVEYQTGGSAGETPIGLVGTIPMFAYAFSLPAPFAASAGVKYWVQIEAFQHGGIPDWGFAAGTGGDSSHYVRDVGAGGDIRYHFAAGDAAYTLLGPVPDTPTDIFLSSDTVAENQPVNTVVGVLDATDPDPNATFTFSLGCAIAGADDGSFNISGTDLRTSAEFNFEIQNTFAICIRVTDQGGLTFDKNFAVSVNNLNEAPTGISLSANSVDENQPANTVVGALTATDPDADATFAFSLACAVAGADDGSFSILGVNLRTSAAFDFEAKSTYNLCVRVTDQGGLAFDKNFVVTVNNVNESANTPGKVTGGGVIGAKKGGAKGTFGFVISFQAGNPAPRGNLVYVDHHAHLILITTSFDRLVIEGTHATFTGTARLSKKQRVRFEVQVDDLSKLRSKDRFTIKILTPSGYAAGGVLIGGNITIH